MCSRRPVKGDFPPPKQLKMPFSPLEATMKLNIKTPAGKSALLLLISSLLILLQYTWQGSTGFNLSDEGFLWYGVQRVLLGEVPILDFMAYDPGRYYWSAALMSITGDNGIMSLRAAVAVFQFLGLFTGLFLIAQHTRDHDRSNVLFWLISAATLVVWMFPRHKLFDISLSILLIGVLTFLIRNPIPRRYLVAGFCVGLIAVFGRNHGVYGAVASLGVITWLNLKSPAGPGFLKGYFLWGIGVAAGFLPLLFMTILIPGFANAFWKSIHFLFEHKATNLPLPVPWPWTVDFSTAPVGETIREVLVGLFFIGTLLFGVLSIGWAIYRKLKEKAVPSAFAASAFLALPYAHFAFSRADVGHLAQGIYPLLVGSLVLLSTAKKHIKWSGAVVLCTASFWVMHAFHPGWQCLPSETCVTVEVSGDKLLVDRRTADDIALLHDLDDRYAPSAQAFIATPFWPGAYALLERKSPMWEIYALFPRAAAFEAEEIERIVASKPAFVLVFDWALDGRDELRFKNTHPLTHQYILDNFEPVPGSHSPEYQIYRARDTEQ